MKLIENLNISEGLSVDTDIKSLISSDLEGREESVIMMKEQTAVEVDLQNNRHVEPVLGDFEVAGTGNNMKKMFEKVDLNSSLLSNLDAPLKKEGPRHSFPTYSKPSEKENVIDSNTTKYDGPSDDTIASVNMNHNENSAVLEKAEELVSVNSENKEKVLEPNSNNKFDKPLQEVNENTAGLKNLRPKPGDGGEKDLVVGGIADEASPEEIVNKEKQLPNLDCTRDAIPDDEEKPSCSNSSPSIRVSQSPPLSALSSNESTGLDVEEIQVECEMKSLASCTDSTVLKCGIEQNEVNVLKSHDNEGPECSITACEPKGSVVSCAGESNISDSGKIFDAEDKLVHKVGFAECSKSVKGDKESTYNRETAIEAKKNNEINEIQKHSVEQNLDKIQNGESSEAVKQSDIPVSENERSSDYEKQVGENDKEILYGGRERSLNSDEKEETTNDSDTYMKDNTKNEVEQDPISTCEDTACTIKTEGNFRNEVGQDSNSTCEDMACTMKTEGNFRNESENNSIANKNSINKIGSELVLRENNGNITEVKELLVEPDSEKHHVLNEKEKCGSNAGNSLLTSPVERGVVEIQGKPEDTVEDTVDIEDEEPAKSLELCLEEESKTLKDTKKIVSESDEKLDVEEGKSTALVEEVSTCRSELEESERLEDGIDKTAVCAKTNTENKSSLPSVVKCLNKEAVTEGQDQSGDGLPNVSGVHIGDNAMAKNKCTDGVQPSTNKNKMNDADNCKRKAQKGKSQEPDLPDLNEVRNRRKRFSPLLEDKTVAKLKRTRTGTGGESVQDGNTSENVKVRGKLRKSGANKESRDSTVKRPSDSLIATEVKRVCTMPDVEKDQNKTKDNDSEENKLDVCDSTTEESTKNLSAVKEVNRLSFLREMNRAKLKKLTRSDLEELILQKICEAISERSTCGELRQRAQSLEQSAKHWQKKYGQLTKQVKDLSMVVRRFQNDWEQKKEGSEVVMPLKITRSVGLQVGSLAGLSNDMTRQREKTATPANTTPNSSHPPKTSSTPSSSLSSSFARAEMLSSPQKVTDANSPSVQSTSPRHVSSQPNLQSTGIKVLQSRSPAVSANISTAKSSPSIAPRPKTSDLKVIDLTDEEDKARTGLIPKSTLSSPVTTVSSNIVSNIGSRPVHVVQQITGTSTPTLITSTAANAGGGQHLTYYVPSTTVPVPSRQLILSSPSQVRPGGVMTVANRPTLVLKGTQVVPMTQAAGTSSNIIRSSTVSNSLPAVPQKPQQVRIAPPVQRAPAISNTVQSLHPAPLPAAPSYGPNNASWKLPPPKPDLKISKVLNRNQQGIVLSWNMTVTNDYEEIASYQLFAYQEGNTPPSPSLWKKVGDVKALPLPMACTLTQFMEGHKYHFAVRAVDVHMRCGPFSAPGHILLTRS